MGNHTHNHVTRLAMSALAATVYLTVIPDGAAEPDPQRTVPASIETMHEADIEAAYFSKTLTLALQARPDRLISADAFAALGATQDTIFIDTRSAEQFATGHIDGAINLPLTDLTERRLADALPSREITLLLYSHQNFGEQTGPIRHDSADLSLNLLSFLLLNQYGYYHVFELGERIAPTDPRLLWTQGSPNVDLIPAAQISASH